MQVDTAAPAVTTPDAPAAQAVDAKVEGQTPDSAVPPAEGAPTELVAVEPETKKEPDKLASKFAALTKREREISLRESKLKEQEKSISDWESAKKSAKDDPLAFLEAHGLSYDAVTDFILNDKRPPKDSYVKKLEERLNEQDRIAKEKEVSAKKREEDQMIADYRKNQKAEIESKKDKFELVNGLGYLDDVYETQVLWFQTHNERISTEQAAEKVEKFLEQTLAKVKDSPKAKKLFGVADTTKDTALSGDEKPEEKRPTPDSVKKKSSTLTNNLIDSTGPGTAHMSDEDRIKKAAQMLRFND